MHLKSFFKQVQYQRQPLIIAYKGEKRNFFSLLFSNILPKNGGDFSDKVDSGAAMG